MKVVTTKKVFLQKVSNPRRFLGFSSRQKVNKSFIVDRIKSIVHMDDVSEDSSNNMFFVGYEDVLDGLYYHIIEGDMVEFSKLLNTGGEF